MVIVAISGPKNSGKTHLIESLIPRVSTLGLRYAVLKHDAHAHMVIDREGKDSWRYRRAGAPKVGIVGPLGSVSMDFESPFGEACDAAEFIEEKFAEVELVLAEGFKDHRLPRIVLIPFEGQPATALAFSSTPATHDEVDVSIEHPLTAEEVMEFIRRLLEQGQGQTTTKAEGRRDSRMSQSEDVT